MNKEIVTPGESLGDELAAAMGFDELISSPPATASGAQTASEQLQPEQEAGDPSGEPAGQEETQQADGDQQLDGEGAGGDEQLDAGDGNGGEITYITELAEELEIDPSELYGIKVKVDDGREFSIGELKDLAKTGAAGDAGAIDAQRAEFEREVQEKRQQIDDEARRILGEATQRAAVPDKVVAAKAELTSLQQRYQAVDWEELRKSDAGEAAFLKQQFNEAYAEAQGQLQQATAEQQQITSQQTQQMQLQAKDEFLKRVPEWNDAEVRKREFTLVDDLSQSYGFSPEEVRATIDPRLRHLLRDYALLKSQYAEADANASRVIEKGNRVLRRGALRRPKAGNAADDLIGRAKKSHDKRDILAAQKALLEQAGI